MTSSLEGGEYAQRRSESPGMGIGNHEHQTECVLDMMHDVSHVTTAQVVQKAVFLVQCNAAGHQWQQQDYRLQDSVESERLSSSAAAVRAAGVRNHLSSKKRQWERHWTLIMR